MHFIQENICTYEKKELKLAALGNGTWCQRQDQLMLFGYNLLEVLYILWEITMYPDQYKAKRNKVTKHPYLKTKFS